MVARHPCDTPACVVIDVDDATRGAFDAGFWRRLRAVGAVAIVVCRSNDLRFAVHAMREGAVDVLVAPVDTAALVAAIDRARVHTAARHTAACTAAQARDLLDTCTHRERAVVMGVAGGHSNKQIASDLACAESTVKVHRSRAMRKLRVSSPVQLIRLVEAANADGTQPSPAGVSRAGVCMFEDGSA